MIDVVINDLTTGVFRGKNFGTFEISLITDYPYKIGDVIHSKAHELLIKECRSSTWIKVALITSNAREFVTRTTLTHSKWWFNDDSEANKIEKVLIAKEIELADKYQSKLDSELDESFDNCTSVLYSNDDKNVDKVIKVKIDSTFDDPKHRAIFGTYHNEAARIVSYFTNEEQAKLFHEALLREIRDKYPNFKS